MKLFKNKAVINFGILSMISLFQIVTTIFLGNKLSKEEYGLFNLIIIQISPTMIFTLMMGKNNIILRHFSITNLILYNWKNDFWYYILKVSFLSVVGGIIVFFVYDLSITNSIVVVAFSILTIAISVLAAYLRVLHKFSISTLLDRGQPLLFFLFITISLLFNQGVSYSFAITSKILTIAITFLIGLYILSKMKEGRRATPKTFDNGGIWIWLSSITAMLMNRFNGLIISKTIGLEELALYGILTTLTTPFSLVSSSITNVYTSRIKSDKNLHICRILLPALIISFVLILFYTFTTPLILDILFKQKYLSNSILTLAISVNGALLILNSVVWVYIVGRANDNLVKKNSNLNWLLLSLQILAFIIFMKCKIVSIIILVNIHSILLFIKFIYTIIPALKSEKGQYEKNISL